MKVLKASPRVARKLRGETQNQPPGPALHVPVTVSEGELPGGWLMVRRSVLYMIDIRTRRALDGCSRRVKCSINISWSQKIQPDARIEFIWTLGPKYGGLIHHVPGVNAPGIMTHHSCNMFGEIAVRIRFVQYTIEPGGRCSRAIPTEIMAVDQGPDSLAEVNHQVAIGKVERMGAGRNGAR